MNLRTLFTVSALFFSVFALGALIVPGTVVSLA